MLSLKHWELRHAAPAAAGYLKGGGSSSSSSSSSAAIDKRLVVDSGVGVSADNSTVAVNVTDGGAFAFADQALRGVLDFAKASNVEANDQVQNTVDFAEATQADSARNLRELLGAGLTLFDRSFGLLDKAQASVREQGQTVAAAYDAAKGMGDEKQLVAYGVLAAVAIVAVQRWGK